MDKRASILFWLLGILLPLAWLAQLWPPSRWAFGLVFGPLWVHILMHAVLFAVLAYLLAVGLRGRMMHAPPGGIVLGALGLVLGVALLQEAIQWAYKARPVVADDLLDVGVDLAGGTVGIAVAWWRGNR